jgi:hypothetical protein
MALAVNLMRRVCAVDVLACPRLARRVRNLSPAVAACGQSQPGEVNDCGQCHAGEDRPGSSVWQQRRTGEQAGSKEGLPLQAHGCVPKTS